MGTAKKRGVGQRYIEEGRELLHSFRRRSLGSRPKKTAARIWITRRAIMRATTVDWRLPKAEPTAP